MQPGSTVGALLRFERPHATDHYEGAEGAERLVRADLPSGEVLHYEGERHAERLMRQEQPSGDMVLQHHYEGEKGTERLVRQEEQNGVVVHYEGKKGTERLVRCEVPSGPNSVEEGSPLQGSTPNTLGRRSRGRQWRSTSGTNSTRSLSAG